MFFLLGYQELWLIFLVSGIRSIGAGIQAPAVNALLPQIVPTDHLMKVNSINATIQPFIMIITPILSGTSKDFTLYLIFMFLGGIPMPFFNAPTTTLLQEMVDPDMQGRVFSVQQLIMSTIMPIGMLIFGPLADLVSIEILLVLTSVLMAIPGLWIFFSREVSHAPLVSAQARVELQPSD